MFFGNAATQAVAVPWMLIRNATEANQFATLVASLTRPFSFGISAPAQGLAAATQQFGTETGGAANGFESAAQIIEIASSGIPPLLNGGATAQARDTALAAGVDLVNSTAVGGLSGIAENYYAQNVIGSTLPGVQATSSTAPTAAGSSVALLNTLSASLGAGAAASLNAIPEPSVSLILAAVLGTGLLRRRRTV